MSEIIRFDGYRACQEKPRRILPVGGYVAQIQGVKLTADNAGNPRIAFRVEIIEGAYENFYHQDYEAAKGGIYEAKYRGVYNIPVPDNSRSEWNLRNVDRFNMTMGAIEGSNPGYTWDWNIESLKGLKVGISVRESMYRGSLYTEIGKFIPLSIIRNHHFRPMGRKVYQEDGYSAPAPVPSGSGGYNNASIPGTNQNMASRQSNTQTAMPAPVMRTAPAAHRYGPNAGTSDEDIPF